MYKHTFGVIVTTSRKPPREMMKSSYCSETEIERELLFPSVLFCIV